MFLFQHPEDYLRSWHAERERVERRNRLLRELRGVTPPFGEAQTRRLAAALAEAPDARRASGRQGQRGGTPCPEMNEPMTP